MSEEESIYITCNMYEDELKERYYGEKIYDIDGNKVVTLDTIYRFIDDLLSELHILKEKYDDLENDLESNYQLIPMLDQIGMSERDFH